MAAAVGAASLDGVVHADAVVVPRRLPRQGGSEPEILEGICGSSAGAEAVRAVAAQRSKRHRDTGDARSRQAEAAMEAAAFALR